MPPQKPSPHRFIAPATPTQTPKPKPKSNLRHAISAQTKPSSAPSEELQCRKITPAKRFVVSTQRQHASEVVVPGVPGVTPRAPDRVEEPASSAEYTPRPKARKLERVESIEEARSSPSRGADEDAFNVVQTVERDATFASEEDEEEEGGENEDEDEMLFESAPRMKRRRTSPPSPPQHHAAPPETPLSASHRFRFPRTPLPFTGLNNASHTPTMTTTTTPATTTARPHFILPAPASPTKPSRPLPEIFSPSRKTQKYVPGGAASVVKGWIIDAAQTGPGTAGIVSGREREDGVRLKVRISSLGGGDKAKEVECWPGSVVFVCGETEVDMYNVSRTASIAGEEEGVRVLLAGQGGVRGAGGVRIRVGSVVGIRAPTWEIDVGGEQWVVGVDWVVL